MSQASQLLLEGVSDAVGFIGGALAGFWLGQFLGWNLFSEGYSNTSIGAIWLVGLGGGGALQAARAWRRANSSDKTHKD